MANTMTEQVSYLPLNLPQNRHGRPPREILRHKVVHACDRPQPFMKRASPGCDSRESSMPASTNSPLQATFPSFMSVFGNGSTPHTNGTVVQASNKISNTDKRPYHHSNSSSFTRRDSSSTFESSESSPTTTISTVGSAITEPSPSSSPESPTLCSKTSSFQSQIRQPSPGKEKMENTGQFSSSFPTLPGVDRSDSPNKKMRNMKNLSVNTLASKRPSSSQLPKLGMTGTPPTPANHAFSAPPTPAFIVPPKAPRRKPSKLGLTLTTPDTNPSNTQDRPGPAPQIPSDPNIQALRLLQTNTNAPLFSPTVAPEGGMRLPPFSSSGPVSHFGNSGTSLTTSPHSNASPIQKQTLEHVREEPDYDAPRSQEVKSPAYPQGPVCIYDPLVYLYLEPSEIEAREFDVVLNVAREVGNPFQPTMEKGIPGKMVDQGVQVCAKTADKGVQVNFDAPQENEPSQEAISQPQMAALELSSRSASEMQMDDPEATAPNTPKAAKPDPEYIHIPWDHNANVVDDLLRLCELIDDRVQQNKRVLVHCQCGVSRSASLVVAYGIYKNPQISVQEAYDTVKSRSRWIGPNMNLIYQLSEFKNKLPRTSASGTRAWHAWQASGSGRPRLNLPMNSDSQFGTQSTSSRSIPQKANSVPSQASRLSTSAPFTYNPPGSAQLSSPSRIGDISPGPLTAPPNYLPSPNDRMIDATSTPPITDLTLRSTPPMVPIAMDVDNEQNLTPTAATQEAYASDKEASPGAMTRDLHEIAKDLDAKSPDHEANASLRSKEHNEDGKSMAPPGSWPEDGPQKPQLNTKQSISDLPIGFSSLLARRQAPQKLPFRQELPRFVAESIQPKALNHMANDDVPPTPSLLSPRAAEFTASPFHRTSAGDLAGSSVFEQGLMSPKAVDEDPRSPHTRSEAPITRSIFDMI